MFKKKTEYAEIRYRKKLAIEIFEEIVIQFFNLYVKHIFIITFIIFLSIIF